MRMALIPILLFVPLFFLNKHLHEPRDGFQMAVTSPQARNQTVHWLKSEEVRIQLPDRVPQRLVLPQPANGVHALTLIRRADGSVAVHEEYAGGDFATVVLSDLEAGRQHRSWMDVYTITHTGNTMLVSHTGGRPPRLAV